MSKPFKLSCCLFGHSLDVRSVTTTSNNAILSGSRDKTAKFWSPNGFNNSYSESMTFRDQKNFVMTVLYLEPTKEFPTGLVITGGNDNVILIYKPGEPFSSFALKEHTNAVSCLAKGTSANSLISGSWDTTAKLWIINQAESSVVTYSGHAAAIWSVLQLPNTNVVTASADKTIGIWSKEGQRLKNLQGHSDCVRGLADFPELNYFVSVSNDASIKSWTYSGENIDTYYGHTNYIYSVSRNKASGEFCFVTSDEDRTVRYWQNGINTETFVLPAQSVWSVACLSNGDVVTGSSDGVVRVFTQDENRFANEETLKNFEEEVNAITMQSAQEIGGVKVSDLPGKEALYDPGKRAGQMKMIREPHGVVAYTWVEDGENSHWEKVGDVLGGTDKDNSGKTTYEGQSYDYVFSVDVEDGKPPLKLPYNKGEDPYKAAQDFLAKNFLPTAYLEQVVDFILKNCKEAGQSIPNSDYVDPFVGTSRYVPGSRGGVPADTGFSNQNCDPFTGSSSYTTSNITPAPTKPHPSADVNAGSSTVQQSEQFFPVLKYHLFESGDVNVILRKLKEFNQQNGSVEENQLESMIKITSGNSNEPADYDILFILLEWPEEIIFPVLDALRLAVRFNKNNQEICSRNKGYVVEKLSNYISSRCRIQNNTMLALRTFCNLCSFKIGEDLLYQHRFDLLENITTLGVCNKNTQIALATFLSNMAILTLNRNDEVGTSILADVLPDIITKLNDPEAEFRAYVALGTLLTSGSSQQNQEVKDRVLDNVRFVEKLKLNSIVHENVTELKRKKCALQVQSLLLK